MNPTLAALLAAVRAAPEDDGLRLVVADAYDEAGEHERAEFVRLQIELAKWEMTPGERFDGVQLADGRFMSFNPTAKLIARERELLAAHHADWLGSVIGKPVLVPATAHGKGRRDRCGWLCQRFNLGVEFGRGFVEDIFASAEGWLASGDALVAEYPVKSVTLTAWPGFARLPWSEGADRLRRRATALEVEFVRRQLTAHEMVVELLGAEWPSVRKWALPEPHVGVDPGGDRTVVHHVNGDPTDNRPENLRAVNFRENRANR